MAIERTFYWNDPDLDERLRETGAAAKNIDRIKTYYRDSIYSTTVIVQGCEERWNFKIIAEEEPKPKTYRIIVANSASKLEDELNQIADRYEEEWRRLDCRADRAAHGDYCGGGE